MNRLVRMVLKNIGKLPGAYVKLCRYAKNPQHYSREQMWSHIQYIMRLAVASGNIDLQVFGKENLCIDEGYLLYGNHQGMFDVVAIAASCDIPLSAVYKKELREIPLLKQVYACTDSYAMDREDVRQSLTVIQKVTEQVINGRRYVIFPEGTRSKSGNKMGAFHGGSFRCALKAKCPIVPMVFVDSFKVLDQKGSDPVKVQLHYLEPIYYEQYKDMKTVEIAQLVKDRIQKVLDSNA